MSGIAQKYGLLLPQFGAAVSRQRLLDAGRRAEEYGFDSIWVRDHLSFRPHGEEGTDRSLVEPFVALSAIAAVTTRIVLGTAALIPFRHPVHTARLLGSLDLMAGGGRVILGIGLGGAFQQQFEAVGIGGPTDRRDVVKEQVDIIRKLATGSELTYDGEIYEFRDLDVRPAPDRIAIWYCGSSAAAVRRAVEYADGWGPTRLPLRNFRQRVARLRRMGAEAGRPDLPATASIWVSPADDVAAGVAKIPLRTILEEAQKRLPPPPSGTFADLEDLDGSLVAGPAETIVAAVRRFQAVGASHVVLDLRTRMNDWDECFTYLGERVLPELRRTDAAVA